MRWILMLVLTTLVVCKGWMAMTENGAFALENLPMGMFYAAMFGSPQLVWLSLCRKPFAKPRALSIASIVTILFVGMAIYFGSLPGTTPPKWGGEARFDVPAAFILEWMIAVIGVLFLRRASKQQAATMH